MIAVFDFSLAKVIYGIQDKGQGWVGPCTSDFVDTGLDSFPLRGDVRFLNHFPAELSIKRRVDGSLNSTLHTAGLDEKISEWRAKGYVSDSDAFGMRYWPKTKGGPEFLGISVALGDSKFSHYQQFMEKHIGRADLLGRLICQFYGFSEPDQVMPDIPSKEEFLDGKYYFGVGDYSINFGVKFP